MKLLKLKCEILPGIPEQQIRKFCCHVGKTTVPLTPYAITCLEVQIYTLKTDFMSNIQSVLTIHAHF